MPAVCSVIIGHFATDPQ